MNSILSSVLYLTLGGIAAAASTVPRLGGRSISCVSTRSDACQGARAPEATDVFACHDVCQEHADCAGYFLHGGDKCLIRLEPHPRHLPLVAAGPACDVFERSCYPHVCREAGVQCAGHIVGFAKYAASYEECAFRCREHNQRREETGQGECHWFTFISSERDAALNECRLFADCGFVKPCRECTSGEKECITGVN